MALIPYPTEFPKEALTMVLDAIRGTMPTPAAGAHACWVVAGYALSQTLGGGPIVAGNDSSLTDEEVIRMALDHEPQAGAVGGLFPWGVVLSIVLRLLIEKFGN